MSTPLPLPSPHSLKHVAAIIALALSMLGGALVLYYLFDLLLIFFLGIILATALQPAHIRLTRWGIPQGLAVLVIYLLFLLLIVLLVLFLGPALAGQIHTFVTELPQHYQQFAASSRSSANPLLQQLGSHLPSFQTILQEFSARLPAFVTNLWQLATGVVSFFIYFVGVLAIGFYWTMEVPHWERVVVSLAPTARRQQILEMWHEIENKLGGFIRGQGLAMLAIGVASGLGYWLIGLPNVLVLAVLAGLFEAIPNIGPILGVIPAALVALPLGFGSFLLVLGFAALLQLFENNVLLPRVMNKTVGISSLMSLFAVFAFGSLYGVLGALVAIPLTVVLQVILERVLVHPDPLPEDPRVRLYPLETFRARLEEMRQRLRERFRDRESRPQSDEQTLPGEQIADHIDQELEKMVERADAIITTVQQTDVTLDAQQRVMTELERTIATLEQSVAKAERVVPASPKQEEGSQQTPPVMPSSPADLQRLTCQAEAAVTTAEETISEVRQNPESKKRLLDTDK